MIPEGKEVCELIEGRTREGVRGTASGTLVQSLEKAVPTVGWNPHLSEAIQQEEQMIVQPFPEPLQGPHLCSPMKSSHQCHKEGTAVNLTSQRIKVRHRMIKQNTLTLCLEVTSQLFFVSSFLFLLLTQPQTWATHCNSTQ